MTARTKTSKVKRVTRQPTAEANLGLARLAAIPKDLVEDTEQYADACLGSGPCRKSRSIYNITVDNA